MLFMPPQYYLISTLAEILYGHQSSEAQRTQVRQLSEGAFGRMVVLSQQSELEDGRILYEGGEPMESALGARHGLIAKLGPGGVSRIVQ